MASTAAWVEKQQREPKTHKHSSQVTFADIFPVCLEPHRFSFFKCEVQISSKLKRITAY